MRAPTPTSAALSLLHKTHGPTVSGPNGVARVSLRFPPTRRHRALTITTPAIDNLFVVQVAARTGPASDSHVLALHERSANQKLQPGAVAAPKLTSPKVAS